MADVGAHLEDEARRDGLLAALRITECDPSVLGVSAHLLTVARRD